MLPSIRSFLAILTLAAICRAGTLVIESPPGKTITSGTLQSDANQQAIKGTCDKGTLAFTNTPADVPLMVQATLADGTTVQGVDLSWYAKDKSPADTPPLTDDDREAIRAIVQDIPSFYNKSTIKLLAGDHSRTTALVELVRDTDFHAGKGNIIWRVELYYFKFQYGGWEKVSQQNKVLRRERFKSMDQYKSATEKLKWSAELGGIKVKTDETKQVKIKPDANRK
jgi:hypothetical protein